MHTHSIVTQIHHTHILLRKKLVSPNPKPTEKPQDFDKSD